MVLLVHRRTMLTDDSMLLAEETYTAFVPHGVHTHARFFFLLWLLFLQDKKAKPILYMHHFPPPPFLFLFPPSPPSLPCVVVLYFSIRRLRAGISSYFGIWFCPPHSSGRTQAVKAQAVA